jgi:COMPASS component BRE2
MEFQSVMKREEGGVRGTRRHDSTATLRMDSSARECSPPLVPSRKRKHAAINVSSQSFSSSPVPSDPLPQTALLPTRNDLSSRPRLTISRFPIFTQASDGSPYHFTEQITMNRIGFRYTPAGISPPGSMLPCRTIESLPTCSRVSWEDRSPFIRVTPDGLGLTAEKGFRSARCNVPIREGKWYMEVKVDRGGGDRVGESTTRQGSHVRLGWGRREAPLNGPVGLDGYSYGIRDKTGEKVTLSRPRPYGRPFFSGDVIGMYISLPPRRHASESDPHDPAHIKRERIAIEFKGQEYFEALEYPQSKEMISLMDYSNKSTNSTSVPSSTKKSATVKNVPDRGRGNKTQAQPIHLRPVPTLPNSHISFFVNGNCQGIAFQDLYDYLPLRTTQSSRKSKPKRNRDNLIEHKHKENPYDDGSLGYYPFISLFNDAVVTLNPGPTFHYPPPCDIDALLLGVESLHTTPTWRPYSVRYQEYMVEQWALDASDEAAAKLSAVELAAIEEEEAKKKALKEKRKMQAEARRKAKKLEKSAEIQESNVLDATDGRHASTHPSTTLTGIDPRGLDGSADYIAGGSPAPNLRNEQFHSPAPSLWRYEGSGIQLHSPAPTITSSIDMHGTNPPSGNNSDNADEEMDDLQESRVYQKSPRATEDWAPSPMSFHEE